MVDSILCTESVKYLYINAFKHVIQSTTKNKPRYASICQKVRNTKKWCKKEKIHQPSFYPDN